MGDIDRRDILQHIEQFLSSEDLYSLITATDESRHIKPTRRQIHITNANAVKVLSLLEVDRSHDITVDYTFKLYQYIHISPELFMHVLKAAELSMPQPYYRWICTEIHHYVICNRNIEFAKILKDNNVFYYTTHYIDEVLQEAIDENHEISNLYIVPSKVA